MVFFLSPFLFASDITGTVLGEGTPVLDAVVYLLDSRGRYAQTRTDEEGLFAFYNVSAPNYRVLVVPTVWDNLVPLFYPSAEDYCDAALIKPNESVVVELFEGSSITGVLESPEGEPLSDMTILSESIDGLLSRGTISDTDGSFIIQGLSPNANSGWKCKIDTTGWPEQYLSGTYEKDQAEIVFNDTDLDIQQLLGGITVEGSVYGSQGVVPEAEIFAYSSSQVVSGESDEHGWFRLYGLPPGEVLVWASAPGHANTYAPNHDRPTEFVPAPEEGMTVDVPLEMPAESILDVFLHENEEPVIGASVLLYNDTNTVGRGAPVDEDGVARIDRLHDGNYQLHIYAENDGYFNEWYQDENGERKTIVLTGSERLSIELTPSALIYGNVLDDDALPVYGAEIYARNEEETIRATTKEDGSYELSGLSEGDWSIELTYQPLCSSDLSYVPTYYPDTPDPNESVRRFVEAQSQQSIHFTMPKDADKDGMADNWERDVGLDADRNDAMEDPDEDGISNLDEYYADSNPLDEKQGCNCSNTSSASLLIPWILLWFRRRS